MRGVRFFRDAELPPESYTEVAGWFEQCHFEAYRVVTAEGAPCHSFCMLAHGTAEAIESAGYHPEPIEATDGGRGGAFLEAGAYWGDPAFGGGGRT